MLVVRTDRATYYTDDNGAVLSRTNGPRGWDYSGKWRLVGVKKRYHSHSYIPLQDAADGVEYGWGVIVDIDHGTPRQWYGERAREIRRAESFDIDYAETLRSPKK